jgi:predicted transport protein
MALTYSKHERLSLQDNPELDEKWVQDRIAEDPKILGLGELLLKDRERIQPKAGRLDLLLQDPETDRRYEVELQLGQTDESHIIRTLEYWDIERKRYPQYDHAAVIIAEDITSRFLNVVGLFNGFIPLIAIQMSAIRVGDSLSLVFTTVLDELRLGLVDEDEETHEATDRPYWEQRGAKDTVQMADRVLELIKQFEPGVELKYNKFYIGLAKHGRPNNFVEFVPQKSALKTEFRLTRTDELDALIQGSGIDTLGYDKRWGQYRVRLSKGDIEKHAALLKQLIERARTESGR